jgi:hypothetical protein
LPKTKSKKEKLAKQRTLDDCITAVYHLERDIVMISCPRHGYSKAIAFQERFGKNLGCEECLADRELKQKKKDETNISADNVIALSVLHTRVLLQYLKMARRFNGSYSPSDKSGPYYSIAEIKYVLEGRPHVRKKGESRHADGGSRKPATKRD